MEVLGESCRLWRLGQGVSPANSARVHGLYRRIESARAAGEIAVHDVVPGYDSLAIHFDPLTTDPADLEQKVEAWLEQIGDPIAAEGENGAEAGEPVVLAVAYDGPDLARVAEHSGLSVSDVVERHAGARYTVAAIGFMPHFPYLLGLDPALATPRLESPRVRVPAGSVAVGNDQTGVYPQDSPGGWNLIGRTDPAQLPTLRPGDRVRFVAAGGGDLMGASSPRLLLNVDTGERGAGHAVDHELVKSADVVNLACGGHAGDAESIRVFSELAKHLGKTVTAHLSYPDREHFGRQRMDLSTEVLLKALDEQRERLPEVAWVKFHGALYHEADRDPVLAKRLAKWLDRAGFTTAIAPAGGVFAEAAAERGLRVLAEAFVERRYHRAPAADRATLLPRSHAQACLTALPEAMAQAEGLMDRREVRLYPSGELCWVEVGTLCIHSDSPIALELARALAARLRGSGGKAGGRS